MVPQAQSTTSWQQALLHGSRDQAVFRKAISSCGGRWQAAVQVLAEVLDLRMAPHRLLL